jgi:hypothetical protein
MRDLAHAPHRLGRLRSSDQQNTDRKDNRRTRLFFRINGLSPEKRASLTGGLTIQPQISVTNETQINKEYPRCFQWNRVLINHLPILDTCRVSLTR